ncbi:MAG TPA: hypothetical protein VGA20_09425 [Gemmatimonadales bacterium]
MKRAFGPRAVAALCCGLLVVGAFPPAEATVKKSVYKTANGKYKWYVCEGVAPEDTACQMKVKIVKVPIMGSGAVGEHPDDPVPDAVGGVSFTGRVYTEWVGKKIMWYSDWRCVRVPQATHCWLTVGGDIDKDFTPGETITMRVEVSGYGWWRVGTRVRLR